MQLVLLGELINSTHAPIAEIATKARPEEMYHYRHTSNWVKRLGLGTEESNRRMQTALDTLWPYALQLFVPLSGDEVLARTAAIPDPDSLRSNWDSLVRQHLVISQLMLPQSVRPIVASRDLHTDHLTVLLTDMQEVAITEPLGVEW